MLNIRTGEPFRDDVNRRAHLHHPSIHGACIEGWSGRARGLTGGAFMGTMLAQQAKSLPYDYEVQYIRGNRTSAYVDTGVPANNVRTVARVVGVDHVHTGNANYIIGVYGGSTQHRYYPALYVNNTQVACRATSNRNIGTTTIGVGDVWDVDFYNDKKQIIVNGTVVLTETVLQPQSRFSIVLFAVRSQATIQEYSDGALAFVKLYDNASGTILRDMIPVVSQGEACFFDRVSRQLFRNAGGGSLTAGPRV